MAGIPHKVLILDAPTPVDKGLLRQFDHLKNSNKQTSVSDKNRDFKLASITKLKTTKKSHDNLNYAERPHHFVSLEQVPRGKIHYNVTQNVEDVITKTQLVAKDSESELNSSVSEPTDFVYKRACSGKKLTLPSLSEPIGPTAITKQQLKSSVCLKQRLLTGGSEIVSHSEPWYSPTISSEVCKSKGNVTDKAIVRCGDPLGKEHINSETDMFIKTPLRTGHLTGKTRHKQGCPIIADSDTVDDEVLDPTVGATVRTIPTKSILKYSCESHVKEGVKCDPTRESTQSEMRETKSKYVAIPDKTSAGESCKGHTKGAAILTKPQSIAISYTKRDVRKDSIKRSLSNVGNSSKDYDIRGTANPTGETVVYVVKSGLKVNTNKETHENSSEPCMNMVIVDPNMSEASTKSADKNDLVDPKVNKKRNNCPDAGNAEQTQTKRDNCLDGGNAEQTQTKRDNCSDAGNAEQTQTKRFLCSICGVRLQHKSSLDFHIYIQHEGGSVDCKLCSKTFRSYNSLQWHKKFYHEIKDGVKCHVHPCEAGPFFSCKDYIVHQQDCHNLRKYCCEGCGEEFKWRSGWSYHQPLCLQGTLRKRLDHSQELKCNECNIEFKSLRYKMQHMRSKHERKKTYDCKCGKTFNWRQSCANHKKRCPTMLVLETTGSAAVGEARLKDSPTLDDAMKAQLKTMPPTVPQSQKISCRTQDTGINKANSNYVTTIQDSNSSIDGEPCKVQVKESTSATKPQYGGLINVAEDDRANFRSESQINSGNPSILVIRECDAVNDPGILSNKVTSECEIVYEIEVVGNQEQPHVNQTNVTTSKNENLNYKIDRNQIDAGYITMHNPDNKNNQIKSRAVNLPSDINPETVTVVGIYPYKIDIVEGGNSNMVQQANVDDTKIDNNSTTIDGIKTDYSTTVDGIKTDYSTTVDGIKIDNSTTVDGIKIDNSTTVGGIKIDNSTAVDGINIDNSTTVDVNRIDNSTTVGDIRINDSVQVDVLKLIKPAKVEDIEIIKRDEYDDKSNHVKNEDTEMHSLSCEGNEISRTVDSTNVCILGNSGFQLVVDFPKYLSDKLPMQSVGKDPNLCDSANTSDSHFINDNPQLSHKSSSQKTHNLDQQDSVNMSNDTRNLDKFLLELDTHKSDNLDEDPDESCPYESESNVLSELNESVQSEEYLFDDPSLREPTH